MALISLTNVQLAYGHHALLDHADFSLESGERVGLIGRNGTGKSSLLNVLAGRTQPDDGQLVRMGGLTVEMVQQEPELDEAHTVYEAVLNQTPQDLAHDQEHDMDAWRRPAMVRALVDRLQLPADTPVSALSGGMRKRVALAQTFINEPKILLMDEPFSALDVQTRTLMQGELLDLWQQSGASVIFVTHDLEEAIALADKVYVLTAGPATVKSVYDIDIPRPRVMEDIRYDSQFVDIAKVIWDDLREEVQIGQKRALASGN